MIVLRERMKVGPKGQVVIPRAFRSAYHILPGDDVIFEQAGESILLEKPPMDIVAIATECAKKFGGKAWVHSNKDHYKQIEKRLKRAGVH